MRKKTGVLFVIVAILSVVVITSFGSDGFSLMTWNVRGYPETLSGDRSWFTQTLTQYSPDVLCVQEIANSDRVATFLATEYAYRSAFYDVSSDGMDNAIFFALGVTNLNSTDPSGFDHRAQLAMFAAQGIPINVLTVHLPWTDTSQRAAERALLVDVVDDLLSSSQYLILAGDFNTTEGFGDTIEGLATSLGLVWLEPANSCCYGTAFSGANYDHILVSPEVAASWCIETTIVTFADEVTARRVSDHRPVLAVFSPLPCSGPTSTTTPTTTPTPVPVPTPPCDCYSGNTLNCGDFPCQSAAQDCFDYCMGLTGNDVHGLDGNDNDGLACESLRKTCP